MIGLMWVGDIHHPVSTAQKTIWPVAPFWIRSKTKLTIFICSSSCLVLSQQRWSKRQKQVPKTWFQLNFWRNCFEWMSINFVEYNRKYFVETFYWIELGIRRAEGCAAVLYCIVAILVLLLAAGYSSAGGVCHSNWLVGKYIGLNLNDFYLFSFFFRKVMCWVE